MYLPSCEVPEYTVVPLSSPSERTATPGANTSTRLPKLEKDARVRFQSAAATVKARAARAGERWLASWFRFPADTTVGTPRSLGEATGGICDVVDGPVVAIEDRCDAAGALYPKTSKDFNIHNRRLLRDPVRLGPNRTSNVRAVPAEVIKLFVRLRTVSLHGVAREVRVVHLHARVDDIRKGALARRVIIGIRLTPPRRCILRDEGVNFHEAVWLDRRHGALDVAAEDLGERGLVKGARVGVEGADGEGLADAACGSGVAPAAGVHGGGAGEVGLDLGAGEARFEGDDVLARDDAVHGDGSRGGSRGGSG
ncbi:alkaline protease [Colletotrichum scovillei]|uniref:Alkaline protease n=1 Tax=Colletotrichum scovillei TaxID=1209932 RepID=A0A9P7RH00_9PEZI|nr:alkaline protease [Colletotrichum scovillei]KAG7076546.1 alkaline protease [Colletotrichum scovillei]KAG7083621.1 alkaline protease [Colletotrichum scovillei]